jgi:peptidoglycan/xylan/chitin deacetylase (PgdA/CDA1 family)
MDTELASVPMVLMYHSVAPYTEDPYQVTVHPDRFEQQMRWLARHGLRGVSMRDLLRGGRGLVGLTFDDGYTDFVTHVMPVLDRYGFTATVFVVAGALGGHNSWDSPGPRKALMTARDVTRAAAVGMEIGSHSMNHCRLPETDAPALADEVRRSRVLLSELAGHEVTGFCYPYGGVGAREVDAVRDAGYDYACAVGRPEVASRHAMPRTFVGDRDTPARLYAKWARHKMLNRGGLR